MFCRIGNADRSSQVIPLREGELVDKIKWKSPPKSAEVCD